MKKTLSWKFLIPFGIGIAIVRSLIQGVIPNFLGVLEAIVFAIGFIDLVRALVNWRPKANNAPKEKAAPILIPQFPPPPQPSVTEMPRRSAPTKKPSKPFPISIIVWSAVVIIVLLLISWYVIFPLWAKSQCSWFTYTIPGQAAVPSTPTTVSTMENNTVTMYLPGKAAVPAKTITRNATDEEYAVCLRHYGL